MSAVERCELSLAQSLDDRDHGGVDEPELEVAVGGKKLPYADVIRQNEVDDRDRPVLDVDQEFGERLGTEPFARQPVEFDHDGSRHQQLLHGPREELRTGSMVHVGAVHRSVESTGVADQRHERGSYAISPARRAASAGTSLDSPAAMNRRFFGVASPCSACQASSAFSTSARSGIR